MINQCDSSGNDKTQAQRKDGARKQISAKKPPAWRLLLRNVGSLSFWAFCLDSWVRILRMRKGGYCSCFFGQGLYAGM